MIAAQQIDATLLAPEASAAQVTAFAKQAIALGAACVMVNPRHVAPCAVLPRSRATSIGTVIDFPFGASGTPSRVAQIRAALADGATDIDVALGLHWAKSGAFDALADDIAALRAAARGCVLKLILETGALTDAEIVRETELACALGADFVKTSTGYVGPGATVHAVSLLRATVDACRRNDPSCSTRVKASGGIKTASDAEAMLAAGADRIGASRFAEILGVACV